eukprot:690403-Amphidinium_carterae.1
MNEIIKKRVGAGSMGFMFDGDSAGTEDAATQQGQENKNLLQSAATEDFMEAGLEPEFIGRIPVRIAISPLTANDLFRIMIDAEDSVLGQCVKEFEGYGITLTPTTDGLRRVAELAALEKTGARALVTVLERTLRDFKFELPSTSSKTLELTRDLVDDPQRTLGELLSSPETIRSDMHKWAAEIGESHKIEIELADDLEDVVEEACTTSRQSVRHVLDKRLSATGVIETLADISKGLPPNAMSRFKVTLAMYENPTEEMEKYRSRNDWRPPRNTP